MENSDFTFYPSEIKTLFRQKPKVSYFVRDELYNLMNYCKGSFCKGEAGVGL